MKVLLLFDIGFRTPRDQNYLPYLPTREWATERDVYKALRLLGHEVRLFGLYDDLEPLMDLLSTERFDRVFNLCESFQNDREFEPAIASLLEFLGVPFTGASAQVLEVCKDKNRTKAELKEYGLPVPKHQLSERIHPIRSLRGLKAPYFVKPVNLESSDGIAAASYCKTESSALKRARFLHGSLGTDALIEEYAEGRELYVGFIGGKRTQIFPPRELLFRRKGTPHLVFASHAAKWNPQFRKRWNVHTENARLDKEGMRRIQELCRNVSDALDIESYCRIDLRLNSRGEPQILEINPNPSLAAQEDFALAARAARIDYVALIDKILRL